MATAGVLGLSTSAGFGDRLGRATVGHVRALRAALSTARGRTIAPIFAQQSARENARTGRTPEQVLADATWGAFAAGWSGPVGADADHVKTIADIDACAAAGYTFYTIDPGEYVASADAEAIGERVRRAAVGPAGERAWRPDAALCRAQRATGERASRVG